MFSSYLQQLLHYSKQIKTIGNNIIVSINSIFGKNICPLCGNQVRSLLPLSNYYFDNLKKHGWKYSFEEIETLNVKNFPARFAGQVTEIDYTRFISRNTSGKQNCTEISELSISTI